MIKFYEKLKNMSDLMIQFSQVKISIFTCKYKSKIYFQFKIAVTALWSEVEQR